MLIQSHTGVIRIFPAIPDSWQNARFENLRAVGAFLVSAVMERGKVLELEIHSENGGDISIHDPFAGGNFKADKQHEATGSTLSFKTIPGETVKLTAIE